MSQILYYGGSDRSDSLDGLCVHCDIVQQQEKEHDWDA